ncbi:MAG: cytochrome c3 family protein, partial [Bacteroidetes bacterium]|nr:cytochrome c3 family protein [Bacteroidota bacterium]
MLKRIISFIFFLTIIGIMILSQSFVGAPTTDDCKNTKISKPNGNKSHFFGLNCMSCHRAGRPGKSCFTIGGSVMDEARG